VCGDDASPAGDVFERVSRGFLCSYESSRIDNIFKAAACLSRVYKM